MRDDSTSWARAALEPETRSFDSPLWASLSAADGGAGRWGKDVLDMKAVWDGRLRQVRRAVNDSQPFSGFFQYARARGRRLFALMCELR